MTDSDSKNKKRQNLSESVMRVFHLLNLCTITPGVYDCPIKSDTAQGRKEEKVWPCHLLMGSSYRQAGI